MNKNQFKLQQQLKKEEEEVFQQYQELPPYEMKLEGHCSQIIYFKISENQKYIYSICRMGEFRQWDIYNKQLLTKIRLNKNTETGFNTCLQLETNEGVNLFEKNQNSQYSETQRERQGDLDDFNTYFRIESQKKNIPLQKGKNLIKEQSRENDLHAAIIIKDHIFGTYNSGLMVSWDLCEGCIIDKYEQNKQQVNTLNHYIFKNDQGEKIDQIVTGSEDFSIKFIDIQENKISKGYKLSGPVQKVQIREQMLYAMSDFYDIFMINIKSDEVVNKLNFEGIINTFYFNDYYLIINQYGDNFCDSKIEFYKLDDLPQQQIQGDDQQVNENEVETPIFQSQFSFKIGQVYEIKDFEDYVMAGMDDGSIQFFQMDIQEKLQNVKRIDEIKYHSDGVNQIDIMEIDGKPKIISSGEDHLVLITDYQKTIDIFRERRIMYMEHQWSNKYQAYHESLYKKKKKTKKPKK